MQTHQDDDFDMDRLEARAKEAVACGASTIAAGGPGESPLDSWQAKNGIHIVKMPDDEQGIVRISVGGTNKTGPKMDYCTFRGDIKRAAALLQTALFALNQGPK